MSRSLQFDEKEISLSIAFLSSDYKTGKREIHSSANTCGRKKEVRKVEKIGIIDLGSNTARLVIVDMFADGHYMVVSIVNPSASPTVEWLTSFGVRPYVENSNADHVAS